VAAITEVLLRFENRKTKHPKVIRHTYKL